MKNDQTPKQATEALPERPGQVAWLGACLGALVFLTAGGALVLVPLGMAGPESAQAYLPIRSSFVAAMCVGGVGAWLGARSVKWAVAWTSSRAALAGRLLVEGLLAGSLAAGLLGTVATDLLNAVGPALNGFLLLLLLPPAGALTALATAWFVQRRELDDGRAAIAIGSIAHLLTICVVFRHAPGTHSFHMAVAHANRPAWFFLSLITLFYTGPVILLLGVPLLLRGLGTVGWTVRRWVGLALLLTPPLTAIVLGLFLQARRERTREARVRQQKRDHKLIRAPLTLRRKPSTPRHDSGR